MKFGTFKPTHSSTFDVKMLKVEKKEKEQMMHFLKIPLAYS